MPHYKDTSNKLYFLEHDKFCHLIPPDCIPITDTEADDIRLASIPIPSPPTYKELRASAYPQVTDYLDAVVKGDSIQLQAYIDACLAIKLKYPKEPL